MEIANFVNRCLNFYNPTTICSSQKKESSDLWHLSNKQFGFIDKLT